MASKPTSPPRNSAIKQVRFWTRVQGVILTVCTVLGVGAFLILGPMVAKSRYDDYALERHHEQTTAVVAERSFDDTSRGADEYFLTMTYTVAGRNHRVGLPVPKEYYKSAKVGDEVAIFYNPDNANHIRTVNPAHTYDPYKHGFFGGLLLIYAIIDLGFLAFFGLWVLLYALQRVITFFKKILG